MLNYSSDAGWVCDNFPIALIAVLVAFSVYPNRVGRKTLRQRGDGTYGWIEWHGGERCSDTDPSEPGGEWDSDGDGDGGD